jgi:hypothetical protein
MRAALDHTRSRVLNDDVLEFLQLCSISTQHDVACTTSCWWRACTTLSDDVWFGARIGMYVVFSIDFARLSTFPAN